MRGAAVQGEEYELSADEFVIPAGERTASITVTPKNNFEGGKTIKLELSPVEGYVLGEYNFTLIEVLTKGQLICAFAEENYVLPGELEVRMNAKDANTGKYFSASTDTKVPFIVGKHSTAIEHVHYEFVDNPDKMFVIPAKKSYGTIKIKFLKWEEGKTTLFLLVPDGNDRVLPGDVDQTEIYIKGMTTPDRYLVMRGRTEQALGVLSHLMDRADAGRELEDIRNSFKEKAPSMKPYFRFMGTWLALFLAGYGLLSWAGNTNALEIALLASFCIALLFPIRSFGVLIILVGVLLSGFQQFVGINVVLYYAPEIFKTMGAATDAALLQQIVVGAGNLSFTVLAIFTVDKFGRRPLMIIGALVMAVSMLILGTTFYTHSVGMGSLVCMLVYTAGFAMSWGPVCWVLLAEIFPNSIRSTVMSIAVAAQWIANFLVSWTFPMLDKNQYLTDTFNHGMAYWIYGVMGILAALFIWKFVPETKGKTLEEMEGYWKR